MSANYPPYLMPPPQRDFNQNPFVNPNAPPRPQASLGDSTPDDDKGPGQVANPSSNLSTPQSVMGAYQALSGAGSSL